MFRAKGVTGTGTLEIISAAGAPRGSMYHHFPGGKSQLTVEALRFESARVSADLQNLIDTGSDASTILVSFTEALATSLEISEFRLGCPVTTAALELSSEDPEVRAVCAEAYRTWQSMIEALLLQRSSKSDQAAAAADAELILATIEGGLLLARAYQDTNTLRRLVGNLCRILER
ncbi:putative TetR family transcriptional regulator [Gordonia effusa NBRC 100432]|uniref:Putative TetR family transcriptional regulator n=2 Tax=Gordonia effusa TaxID=263908 RepID=H0R0A8_9ACTN|nr:putative TetR family transcriptional regulator [Gordonia effusa NBRC 100432]